MNDINANTPDAVLDARAKCAEHNLIDAVEELESRASRVVDVSHEIATATKATVQPAVIAGAVAAGAIAGGGLVWLTMRHRQTPLERLFASLPRPRGRRSNVLPGVGRAVGGLALGAAATVARTFVFAKLEGAIEDLVRPKETAENEPTAR